MTKRNSVSGLSGLAWSPSQNWPLTMRMKRRPLNSWLRKTDSWTSSGVSWRNSSGSVNSDVYSWSVRIRCCRSGPVDPWNPTVPRPSDVHPLGLVAHRCARKRRRRRRCGPSLLGPKLSRRAELVVKGETHQKKLPLKQTCLSKELARGKYIMT